MLKYEYNCTSCGHEFEAEQRITEDPIRTCAKCSKDTAVRRISAAPFLLRGGGWYADGYASKSDKTAESSEDAA